MPLSPKLVRRSVREYRAALGADFDVRQLAFQLAELLRPPQRERRSFGELALDWLSRIVRVQRANEERHVRHLAALHGLLEPQGPEDSDGLTKAEIERTLNGLALGSGGTLGPATLNKLRSTGRLIIEDARANWRWAGPNPFEAVRVRRVPQKPYPRISAEELARALAHLRPDRMRECIWQIHAGTRPGEQKALRKCDVDLVRGFVSVHRSNARDETKTGKARELPIPAGARAALIEAMRLSPSDLVFPRPDGTQQRPDAKLSKVLRSALKCAGVITGHRFSCRRKGCGFTDEMTVDASRAVSVRLCPRCGFKLWCEGIPKHFTSYGLRHAAASLHREAGADALAVKMAMGWVARDVGDDVYTHVDDQRFAAELGRLVIAPKPHRP